MSDKLLVSDPEEVRLIMNHRAELARENNIITLRQEMLKVAFAYCVWLNENKAGSTYSTFCDDFGYQLPEALSVMDVERNTVFAAVGQLLALATAKAEAAT
jgi:hypothetical protein